LQGTALARASAWGVLLGVMFIERAMFVPQPERGPR
jgi:hypothetical protein